jgi:hypothetical protein
MVLPGRTLLIVVKVGDIEPPAHKAPPMFSQLADSLDEGESKLSA